jgi:chromosome segregation ATPase
LNGATALELPEGVTIEQRVGDLEARITSLGPINPLALEELAGLEERYRELDVQVSDVRSARRELQEVIRALDEEIMQTFSSAVADVNEHFSGLIAMLFPGGQGRLILTEPDDPLTNGAQYSTNLTLIGRRTFDGRSGLSLCGVSLATLTVLHDGRG